MSILDKIPGFRSRTIWKAVVATCGYGVIAAGIIGAAADGGFSTSGGASDTAYKPVVTVSQNKPPSHSKTTTAVANHINPASPPPYQIVSQDGFDGIYVVTTRMVTKEQIVGIVNGIENNTGYVDQWQHEGNSSLNIFFTDDKRAIENLGWNFAEAEIAFTNTPPAGALPTNYRDGNVYYSFGIDGGNSGRLPRDDTNYPTPHELDIYFAWENYPNQSVDAANSAITSRYHISVDELNRIINKCDQR